MTTAQHDDLASLEAGLDALETHVGTGPSRLRQIWSATWPPLVFVAVLVGGLAGGLLRRGRRGVPAARRRADRRGACRTSGGAATCRRRLEQRLPRPAGLRCVAGHRHPAGLLVGAGEAVRRAVGPILSGLQSLPSVAWVPPPRSSGSAWTTRRCTSWSCSARSPPSPTAWSPASTRCRRCSCGSGRTLGARGSRPARHVSCRRRCPATSAGLRQGWAFSWRSLMAAELIARSPELGLGRRPAARPDAARTSDIAGVIADVLRDPLHRHRHRAAACSRRWSGGCCAAAACWRARCNWQAVSVLFPLHLRLEGKRVLVVGAGPVGVRRARAASAAGADVVVVALEAPEDLELRVERRSFRPSDLDGAWLVLACTGVVDDEVAALCHDQRIWCAVPTTRPCPTPGCRRSVAWTTSWSP